MSDNLIFWDSVCKTNPDHTKPANVRGNKITAIDPQQQILAATKKFGIYGTGWGFSEIELDFSMLDKIGVVIFKGEFFYILKGEAKTFPIISSISAFRDNAMMKPDADFAKKVETDTLTKALSKLGFNADVFMGLYDDNKYVQMMEEEFDTKARTNKSSNKNNNEPEKPWYNEPDYQADLAGMTEAIRSGTSVEDVIRQVSQNFKVSNKYRDLIRSI